MKFLSLICFLPLWAYAQNIEVHYALKSDNAFHSILTKNKHIRSELEKLTKTASTKGYKVKIRSNSSEEKLIQALNSPQTSAVIWIGHAKLGYGQDRDIYNAFLVDSESNYITKNILQAAHADLAFVAINTCFTDEVKKFYHFEKQKHQILTHSYEDTQNSFEQLTNIIQGTIDIFRNSAEFIKQMPDANIISEQELSFDFLEIHYQDLLSNHFGYDVMVNDQLIGTLSKESQLDFKGKILKFNFLSGTDPLRIEIVPTDLHRKRLQYKYPIDNIIIHNIKLNHEIIFTGPLNIGDEDFTDKTTGLTKILNQNLLESSKKTQRLILEL